jgi:hypothetical protein
MGSGKTAAKSIDQYLNEKETKKATAAQSTAAPK